MRPIQLTSRTIIKTEVTTDRIGRVTNDRALGEQVQAAAAARPPQARQAHRKRAIELKLEQAREEARVATLELELLQFGSDE